MSNSMKAIRARKKIMSLQDDSTALCKDLEKELRDKIGVLDRETEALLQSGIICFWLDVPEYHRRLAGFGQSC